MVSKESQEIDFPVKMLAALLDAKTTPYREVCTFAQAQGISAFGEWRETGQWTLCIGVDRRDNYLERIASAVRLFAPAIKPDSAGWARFVVTNTHDQSFWMLHYCHGVDKAQLVNMSKGAHVEEIEFQSLNIALAHVALHLWPQGSGTTEQEFNEHPFILTLEHIMSMHNKMADHEKNALTEWERINSGSGGKGTTDWPG